MFPYEYCAKCANHPTCQQLDHHVATLNPAQNSWARAGRSDRTAIYPYRKQAPQCTIGTLGINLASDLLNNLLRSLRARQHQVRIDITEDSEALDIWQNIFVVCYDCNGFDDA